MTAHARFGVNQVENECGRMTPPAATKKRVPMTSEMFPFSRQTQAVDLIEVVL